MRLHVEFVDPSSRLIGTVLTRRNPILFSRNALQTNELQITISRDTKGLSYLFIGFSQLLRAQPKAACASFETSIALITTVSVEEKASLYIAKATALTMMDDKEAALRELNKAARVAVDPGSRDYIRMLIAEITGDQEAQLKMLDRFVASAEKRIPDRFYSYLLYRRGSLRVAMGDAKGEKDLRNYLRVSADTTLLYEKFCRADAWRTLCELDAALSEVQSITRTVPQNPGGFLVLSALEQDRENTAAARSASEHAAALDPNNPFVQLLAGEVYPDEADPKFKEASCGHALALQESARAYLCRGDARWAMGQRELAISDFEQAITLSSSSTTSADAHYHLGKKYESASQVDLALEHYKKSLALSPRNSLPAALCATRIGWLYESRHDDKAAMQFFTRAIQSWPHYGQPFAGRARLESKSGHFEAALRDLDHAISIARVSDIETLGGGLPLCTKDKTASPLLADYLFRQAILHEILGHRAAAIGSMREALQYDPQDSDAHRYLAKYLEKQGALAEASSEYDKAVEHGSKRVAPYADRGAYYLKRRNWQAAVDDLSHVITLDSNNIFALEDRSIAFVQLGKHELALRDIDAALTAQSANPSLKVQPDDSVRHLIRGAAYLGLHREAEALAEFQYADRHSSRPSVRAAIKAYCPAIRDSHLIKSCYSASK